MVRLMAPSRRDGSRQGHDDALTVALQGDSISQHAFENVITDLVLLRDEDFNHFAHLRPALRSRSTLSELIRHAHGLLSTAPHECLILSELAIRVADALQPAENDGSEINHARGDAWQSRTAALIEYGDVSGANIAAENAERFYAESKIVRAGGMPCLALLKARLLAEMGDLPAALKLADDTASLFRNIFDDRRRYLIARVFCANILLEMERYGDALDAYDIASEIAKEQEDTSTLAFIVAMIGNTQTRIDNHEGAREAFSTAIELFTVLRKPVETARMRIRIGMGLMTRGQFDEAIAELERSRDAFLHLGMPIVAAQASLEMVNAMLLGKRHRWVQPLCREMIETFTKAHLHREAQKALGYLSELAIVKRGRLTTDELDQVKDFMQRLEREPSITFVVPGPNQA